jgi:hypothetical protein
MEAELMGAILAVACLRLIHVNGARRAVCFVALGMEP